MEGGIREMEQMRSHASCTVVAGGSIARICHRNCRCHAGGKQIVPGRNRGVLHPNHAPQLVSGGVLSFEGCTSHQLIHILIHQWKGRRISYMLASGDYWTSG
jgi:hypothetical protein